MKHILTVILSLLCVASFAQLRIEGNAYQYANAPGVDYLFVVTDIANCNLNTNGESATWYELHQAGDSLQVATGTDYLYPDHGITYLVHIGGKRIASVVVFDYEQLRLKDSYLRPFVTETDRCEKTHLSIEGPLPQILYVGGDFITHTVKRTAILTYHTLAWNEQTWADTLITTPIELQGQITIDAHLCRTSFLLESDSLAYYLQVHPDTLATQDYDAVAVVGRLQTITTIRGTEAENRFSNESNRPKENTQLNASAPLDILFKANPNKPTATYYDWRIMKGNNMIVHRTEEEHRYTFTEAGSYQVKLVVSNALCQTDTMDTVITVTVSKLQVPNVFTPNGDGKNDEFRVAYESIIQFDCWVYNRWGHEVYHWTDPAKGWDGTINGRPAAVGGYVYIIRATGADGLKYELKGVVNLVGR
ncbi:MAG: gliding motility-associated C-terminal domain-containing protein [Paludibacteraceae bacterium]|nr:gliding motility-associated C-terminal domain-containing protein [Paludibacteraceae bacterium]